MWKWIVGLILAGVAGFIGWGVYQDRLAGYHTRPEMPPGAFSISYRSGLRAILVDVPDERETRRYLGYPFDVPFYLEEAWAFCSPPEGPEIDEAERWLESGDDMPGMRVDAVCRLDVDGETVIRGIIATVPKL
jgi:hypothetical protein